MVKKKIARRDFRKAKLLVLDFAVVFEEISTKHYKNDSYYTDKRIYTEPNLRKTYIERWP